MGEGDCYRVSCIVLTSIELDRIDTRAPSEAPAPRTRLEAMIAGGSSQTLAEAEVVSNKTPSEHGSTVGLPTCSP